MAACAVWAAGVARCLVRALPAVLARASRRRRTASESSATTTTSPLRGRHAAASTGCRCGSCWPSPSAALRAPSDTSSGAAWSLMFVLVLLSPPVSPGWRSRSAVARSRSSCARGRRSTAHERFVWLLSASRSGCSRSGSSSTSATLRRHAELSLQHRLQGRLPGVVPACDRRERGVFFVRRRFGPRLRAVVAAGARRPRRARRPAYPVAATYSRSAGFSEPPTLDGERWLDSRAGDAAAIRWLRENVDGHADDARGGRARTSPGGPWPVSTFTGLPDVIALGRARGAVGPRPGTRRGRRRSASTRRPNAGVARRLLARYGVRYVFVGSLERIDYPAAGLAKFEPARAAWSSEVGEHGRLRASLAGLSRLPRLQQHVDERALAPHARRRSFRRSTSRTLRGRR